MNIDAVGVYIEKLIIPPSDKFAPSAIYLQHREDALRDEKQMLGMYRSSQVYTQAFLPGSSKISSASLAGGNSGSGLSNPGNSSSTVGSSGSLQAGGQNIENGFPDLDYYTVLVPRVVPSSTASLAVDTFDSKPGSFGGDLIVNTYETGGSCTETTSMDRKDSFELQLLTLPSLNQYAPTGKPVPGLMSPTACDTISSINTASACGSITAPTSTTARPARAAANVGSIVEREKEIKAKWTVLYKRASKLLSNMNKTIMLKEVMENNEMSNSSGSSGGNTAAGSSGSASSTCAGGMSGSSSSMSTVSHSAAILNTRLFSEAHAILLESIGYPLYVNSIGEDNTSHLIYTCLGEILKVRRIPDVLKF